MLASRKALMSNLNYVHLQHVSLGVHLSMRPQVIEAPINQDTGLKDVSGCHHQWKDNTETALVDANSNDPSVPCQCCDQHSRQVDTLQYSLQDHAVALMCDDCLSPNDLPLSPLSPSSPSTDSSSSSDFTLDDSPISMYYKEYSQEALDSPDQQPDIIPLDVATEAPDSPQRQSSMSLLPQAAKILRLDSSLPNYPENVNYNNTEPITARDWNSASLLDSNCNGLVENQQFDQTSLSSTFENTDTVIRPRTPMNIERLDSANANHAHITHCSVNCDLPSLSFTGNFSTETPKKTITSFHELAQKRRKSGGMLLPQLKKDRSDWLIVFSPDTEQPPVNELTASGFYYAALVPQTHALPAGKEVTTFKELRYRNTLNKQNVHQGKVHSFGEMAPSKPSAAGYVSYLSCEKNGSHHLITKEKVLQDTAAGDIEDHKQHNQPKPDLAGSYQEPAAKMQQADIAEVPQKWSLCGQKIPEFVDTFSATNGQMGQHGEFTLKSDLSSNIRDRPEKDIVSTKAVVRGRGMADGDDKRYQEAGERTPLMANGEEDSVQHQKKCLLIAIGNSVEKIVSHFNTSRNQVQKTQLGDSRLSPSLGYLILNNLCPSLYALLGDGLKPHQKDVIIGRRRLSPWSLVEVSTKTGPKSLQKLFSKVSSLQQLRDPQRRFNAFIYGLLNTKQLDIWVSHLHHTYAQLSVFFLPSSGFLPLAAERPELHEELILTLQPLSALTFHIDLLFEHHHLQLQDLPSPQQPLSLGQTSHNWGVPSFQHILDIGEWITHNLTGSAEKAPGPPSKGKSEDRPEDACNGSPTFHSRDCPRELSVQSVDILPEVSVHSKGPPQSVLSPGAGTTQDLPSYSRDSSNSWWEHLNQASRMYLPSKTDSLSFTKLKNLTSWGTSATGHDQSITSKGRDSVARRGFEETSYNVSSQDAVSARESQKHLFDHPNDSMEASKTGDSGEGTKLSYTSAEQVQATRTLGGSKEHHGNEERGNWLGQLFGSSHGREMETRNVKSRRPSSWLPPNVNVWSLIRKPFIPEKPEIFPEEPGPGQKSNHKHERSLRALCDHAASGETQLSFKKGDILRLLGTVDEDWIQCRRGSDTGLVPVGYTSLIL